MTDKKKHPLEDPIDNIVENDGVTIHVMHSTIGIQPLHLTFTDTDTGAPLGEGDFNVALASRLLGEKSPPKVTGEPAEFPVPAPQTVQEAFKNNPQGITAASKK